MYVQLVATPLALLCMYLQYAFEVGGVLGECYGCVMRRHCQELINNVGAETRRTLNSPPEVQSWP